jgi:hypothetical protein
MIKSLFHMFKQQISAECQDEGEDAITLQPKSDIMEVMARCQRRNVTMGRGAVPVLLMFKCLTTG